MSGNCSEETNGNSLQTDMSKDDYKTIKDKDVDGHFRRYLIMSLAWRYS